MEKELKINMKELEEIKQDIIYIEAYNKALNIEKKQHDVYVNEKINLIEKHLNNIKKICKI